MKTSRSIVCQTNMHLIMQIENAFKFCGKLTHFYNERISFLFYCEDGKRGAVSWLSLHAVEVKQTSHLLDVCRFRLFLWQFDGFFRKPIEDFPLSSIFNTAGFVYSACTSASVVSGTTRLDSMYSCPGRYSPLQRLLMFGAEFVTRSMFFPPFALHCK